MLGLGKFEPHFDLMHQMADTVDASIETVLAKGETGAQELRSAMIRCAYCSDVEGCREFLDTHKDGAEAPMQTCPNSDFLMSLKS